MATDNEDAGSEGSAFCSVSNDFYESAARKTMGDLCENVFAPLCLTPSEFLHSEFHQRTLYSTGALLNAFQTAALAQAEILEVTPRERLRQLTTLFDGVVAEVRARGKLFSTGKFRPGQYPNIAADLGEHFQGGELIAALLSSLSIYLDGSGSWLAKIHKIVLLFTDDLDGAALEACDRILSEIILSRSAMGELLGSITSLEEVTPMLIALHDGALSDGGPPDRGDVVTRQSSLANIARLIATDRFPWTRAAVADVIGRVLEVPKRYRKEDSGSEIMAVLETFALFETPSSGPCCCSISVIGAYS